MTRRYIDAVTWQNMTLHKLGRLKLAVRRFDGAQFVGRQNRDTLSFPKGQRRAKRLQLTDPSAYPKDCPQTRRESCLGLLCVGLTGLFVLIAMKVSEVAIERAVALVEWQDLENYIYDHLWVTSPTAPVAINSYTLAATWPAGGDA